MQKEEKQTSPEQEWVEKRGKTMRGGEHHHQGGGLSINQILELAGRVKESKSGPSMREISKKKSLEKQLHSDFRTIRGVRNGKNEL